MVIDETCSAVSGAVWLNRTERRVDGEEFARIAFGQNMGIVHPKLVQSRVPPWFRDEDWLPIIFEVKVNWGTVDGFGH